MPANKRHRNGNAPPDDDEDALLLFAILPPPPRSLRARAMQPIQREESPSRPRRLCSPSRWSSFPQAAPGQQKSGNPLSNQFDWINVKCPKCLESAKRETDTFDTFFESSWYFARFTDPNFNDAINKNNADYWLPVDQYIGGIEHAVLHLLYSRFFIKAMNKLDLINLKEPFKSLQTQGMVCHQTYKNSNNEWIFPKDVVKINDKMSQIGFKKDSESFIPHITVAKINYPQKFNPDLSIFLNSTYDEVEFSVDKIQLLESKTLPEGLVYKTLNTFSFLEK